jgi:16S rRNA (cytosine1402-N4)-methyltransferase
MAREIHGEGQAHQPVLLEEVIHWLRPETGGTFVDCTVGLGGHAEGLLAASPSTRVIGIDRDPEALTISKQRLANFEPRFRTANANFTEVAAVLAEMGEQDVSGMLADLGVSSLQFDKAERGFSFAADAPLDMRMNQSDGQTAADLISRLPEQELADLIFEYGEERGARRIARAIVKARQQQPITTTGELASLVIRALNVPGRWRIHPATRTFQAFRIAVNDELRALQSFIPAALSVLGPKGRLAIISFHSLEDRIVKRSLQLESGRCLCQVQAQGPPVIRASDLSEGPHRPNEGDMVCSRCGARKRIEVLTRKPVRATSDVIARNPRSRSAILRVCERL